MDKELTIIYYDNTNASSIEEAKERIFNSLIGESDFKLVQDDRDGDVYVHDVMVSTNRIEEINNEILTKEQILKLV